MQFLVLELHFFRFYIFRGNLYLYNVLIPEEMIPLKTIVASLVWMIYRQQSAGEKTNQWLAEQKEHDEDLQKQMQEIQAMQRQLEKQEQQNGAGNGSEKLQEELKEAMSDLDGQNQHTLENNSHSFSQAMEQAMQETKQTKDSLKSLLGGTSADNGDAVLKKVPLRDQISLAEKIASNKQMKEIADWAGRFKQIART